jgi:RNA polymerase sigma factor (sigma-70 family)
MVKIDDEYYLSGLRRQDDKVLSMLYKSYYGMVLHLILQNSGNEEEAKDVYQEGILVFYEKVQEGITLTCSIKTFLYSVCRKIWLKKLASKHKYVVRIEDASEIIEADELLSEAERKEEEFKQMSEALHKLGEPCRSLIEDFYIREISMLEITKKFRYTNTDNAKNQKYKCLQRLKRIFFRKDERQS